MCLVASTGPIRPPDRPRGDRNPDHEDDRAMFVTAELRRTTIVQNTDGGGGTGLRLEVSAFPNYIIQFYDFRGRTSYTTTVLNVLYGYGA